MASPSFLNAFDSIRIVNLAARLDRRREMEHQLSVIELDSDPRVRFFPALSFVDPGPFRRPGSHGAFRSHLALLEEAARQDQSILILQDDCDFLVPQIFEFRMPDQWDIFYGGYHANDPRNLHDSDIVGAHFMGFSARAVRAAADYLSRYLDLDFPPDPVAVADPAFDPAIRPPIDGAFVWFRRAHPQLTTTFALLGVQRASRTDIGDQRFFDKVPVVRDIAELARRAKRRVMGAAQSMKPTDVTFGRPSE